MTTQHTKGPLQVLITDGETMKGANCVLISENGDQIARCSAPFPFDTSWDERDANARRLALAWNCHDQLLEALKFVIDANTPGRTDGPAYHTHDRMMRLAAEAIAATQAA